jgi:hypothetical protein
VTCNACGRFHKLGYTVCDVANHPDINKTSMKWNESDVGVLYKSLGYGSIKPFKVLNSNKNGFKVIISNTVRPAN